MKDSPAIILASGLAGLLGSLLPTAQGWILDQSVTFMGTEVSAESLGIFTVSGLLSLPVLLIFILGAMAMKTRFASRRLACLTLLASLGTLFAWFVQKTAIDQLSVVGVGPSLGLILLLVSGLGGMVGGIMLILWPQNVLNASKSG